MSNKLNFIVEPDQHGQRLDRFLSFQFPNESRSRIQDWIQKGAVEKIEATGIALTAEKQYMITSTSFKVKAGDCIVVVPPKSIESEILPWDYPLDIIFEDKDLLVINKPSGMVVHPAAGHYNDTLVNALLAYCKTELSGIGGVMRPGIVHRLDKDTSGLMVVAKNDFSHNFLSRQFHPGDEDCIFSNEKQSVLNTTKQLKRKYKAFVYGTIPSSELVIDTLIARHPNHRQKMAVTQNSNIGKQAITYLKQESVWRFFGGKTSISLLDCVLGTGRTHQIRVHCQSIACPLLGDPVYENVSASRKKGLPEYAIQFSRQALHAYSLSFIHPRSMETMEFEIELPCDLDKLMQALSLSN